MNRRVKTIFIAVIVVGLALSVVSTAMRIHRLFNPPPSAVSPLLLQLRRPFYSSQLVSHCIHQELYKTTDPKRWIEIRDGLVRVYGSQYELGLIAELRLELDAGRADRAKPILEAFLPGAFEDHRIEFPLEQAQLAKFISELSASDAADPRVTAALLDIFARLTGSRPYDVYNPADRALMNDNDRLAVACIPKIIGQGHDPDLRRYAEARAPLSPEYGDELREIIAKLK